MACLVQHQVPIRKAAVMHVRRGEFLLILMDFVKFGAHLSICMASSHLSTEDVSALCRCSLRSLLVSCNSWPARAGSWPLSMHLCYHVHLIRILHHKLPRVSSVCGSNAA